MSRRRAASLARSASAGIVIPLVVKTQLTAEVPDVGFEGQHDGEMARVDEGVSRVLKYGEEFEGLVKPVPDVAGRFLSVRVGHRRTCWMVGVMFDGVRRRSMRWWMRPTPPRRTVTAPSP